MPNKRIERLDTSRIAQIMSVALDEFSRHCYQEASFNRIIKASQMAKGTMYYYFTSKEDLFMTLYKATIREFNRLLPLLKQTPNNADQFWQYSRELLDAIHNLLLTKPNISQFILNFLTRGEQQEEHPARAAAIHLDQWLQAWLLQGQRLNALRTDLSLEHLTALCWGVWQAVHPNRDSIREGLDHTSILLELMDRLFRPIIVDLNWPSTTDSSRISVQSS